MLLGIFESNPLVFLGEHVEISTDLWCLSPRFPSILRGNRGEEVFPLNSGVRLHCLQRRKKADLSVRFLLLLNHSQRWSTFFPKESLVICPSSQKRKFLTHNWKRIPFEKVARSSSKQPHLKNKKLVTKGMTLWLSSRTSISWEGRNRLNQILGLHFWVLSWQNGGGLPYVILSCPLNLIELSAV